MVESHVLSALIEKRREIAGRIEHTQSELRQLVIDLDNIDAAIRIFDPEIDLADIRPKLLPARSRSFRGQIMRTLLAELRRQGKPLPTLTLAVHVMKERGLSTDDKPLLLIISKRVGSSLRQQRRKGLVEAVPGQGRHVLWQIKR